MVKWDCNTWQQFQDASLKDQQHNCEQFVLHILQDIMKLRCFTHKRFIRSLIPQMFFREHMEKSSIFFLNGIIHMTVFAALGLQETSRLWIFPYTCMEKSHLKS